MQSITTIGLDIAKSVFQVHAIDAEGRVIGDTVAETSVLVHEMVHHLQNLADVKFSCPDERERLAYKAQGKWLAVFGKSLAEEFDLDPFTLFAKTLCLH